MSDLKPNVASVIHHNNPEAHIIVSILQMRRLKLSEINIVAKPGLVLLPNWNVSYIQWTVLCLSSAVTPYLELCLTHGELSVKFCCINHTINCEPNQDPLYSGMNCALHNLEGTIHMVVGFL